MSSFVDAPTTLQALWREAGLPDAALAQVELPGAGPVLPSSFRIGLAAQTSLAAAALAAAELWHLRQGGGPRQRVSVHRREAVAECTGWFTLNGETPDLWDPLSGLYPCGPDGAGGWVRIHANFTHHRDGALRLLGLGPGATRDAVTRALAGWQAQDFETAAAQAGLVVAAARSFAQWDAHAQGQAVARLPLVDIQRIGDAAPLPWPGLHAAARPLAGLRVLDLTRILAGPVAGRTLAAHGAQVLLVNGPHLPNIAAMADTSRGKRSAHVDLRAPPGRDQLTALVRQAHVFLQSYRPSALASLGFGTEDLVRLRPGIVCVSLSAYGHAGPWAPRRGFDSLVQTASGFNHAEAAAAGSSGPQAMPMQILDYAAGYLLAFGAQAALWRQAHEGGSWQVRVSLAGVGHWLRTLGQDANGMQAVAPSFDDLHETVESGFGRLVAMRHAARLSHTPVAWDWPPMPPGTHAPAWVA